VLPGHPHSGAVALLRPSSLSVLLGSADLPQVAAPWEAAVTQQLEVHT
jgi:hypothetical protein